MKCPIHKIDLICFCPACRGAVTSERKARSSRRNGRLGGRPRKSDVHVSQRTLYRRKQERLKQQAAKAARRGSKKK